MPEAIELFCTTLATDVDRKLCTLQTKWLFNVEIAQGWHNVQPEPRESSKLHSSGGAMTHTLIVWGFDPKDPACINHFLVLFDHGR